VTYYNSSHLCDNLVPPHFPHLTTLKSRPPRLHPCPSPRVEGCGHLRPCPVDHATSTTPHPPRHVDHATSTTCHTPCRRPQRQSISTKTRQRRHVNARHVNHSTSTSATYPNDDRTQEEEVEEEMGRGGGTRRWDEEEVGRGGESTQRRGQDDASHVDPQCRPPAATLADPCRREPHRWCHVHVSHVDASRIDGCHVDVSCIDGCHVDASHIDTQRRRHEPRRRADGVNATLTIPRGLCELPPFL
jgi:hypothetical protein